MKSILLVYMRSYSYFTVYLFFSKYYVYILKKHVIIIYAYNTTSGGNAI